MHHCRHNFISSSSPSICMTVPFRNRSGKQTIFTPPCTWADGTRSPAALSAYAACPIACARLSWPACCSSLQLPAASSAIVIPSACTEFAAVRSMTRSRTNRIATSKRGRSALPGRPQKPSSIRLLRKVPLRQGAPVFAEPLTRLAPTIASCSRAPPGYPSVRHSHRYWRRNGSMPPMRSYWRT